MLGFPNLLRRSEHSHTARLTHKARSSTRSTGPDADVWEPDRMAQKVQVRLACTQPRPSPGGRRKLIV